MAEFIPFDNNVEVSGKAIKSQLEAVKEDFYKEILAFFFKKYGIDEIKDNLWYPQEKWLKVLKEIKDNIGPHTLFLIGKAIPDNAKFPENIKDLKSALESIDIAYHMNHRGGDIGYYKLIEYDAKDRKAIMECKNPYPDEFDKGIIVGITRKFAPEDSIEQIVEIDTTKPTRRQGAESTWYLINW